MSHLFKWFLNILTNIFISFRIYLYKKVKIPYLNLEKKIIDFYTFYFNYQFYEEKVSEYIEKEKISFKSLLISKSIDVKFVNYNELVDYIKMQSDNVSTCHIIASGSSVLESYNKINKNDIVIGFNFSALLDIKFDLYFVEIGSEERESLSIVSEVQHQLLNSSLNKIKYIIFKNIWENKIDFSYVSKKYSIPILAIKDIYFNTIWSENEYIDAKIVLNSLLDKDEEFIKQSFTTTLTCLILAIHSSFKNVVIHGWDFYGPHFYCSESTKWPLETSKSSIEYLKNASLSNNVHLTFEKKLLIALKQLKKKSKKYNINIYSGSDKSYLSNIFPVYKFEDI